MQTSTDKPQTTYVEVIDGLGAALDGFEVRNNLVLCAIYRRPEKTAGGIILTDSYRDEDKWQGKVSIVLKKGPEAFKDDAKVRWGGQDVSPGDFVVSRTNMAWPLDINGVHCRLIADVDIVGTVKDPLSVF